MQLVELLQACRARPSDDLPRLILADWLEEHDESARAEFVRVQVELSHNSSNRQRVQELRARELRLLQENLEAWFGPAFDQAFREMILSSTQRHIVWQYQRLRFQRGLLQGMTELSTLTEGEERIRRMLCEQRDWVESITIHATPEDFIAAKLPEALRQILHASFQLTDFQRAADERRWVQLASSENFRFLRGLQVSGVAGDTVLAHLEDAIAAQLVELRLHTPPVSPHWFTTLPFTSLATLDISQMDATVLQAIGRSPHFKNLIRLPLHGRELTDAALVELFQSPLARSLRATSFPNTGLGDAGCQALASSPLLHNLHDPCLNLMMNQIGDAGAIALAQAECLQRYRELVLRENQISDAGAIAIAHSPHVSQLEYLDFWRNRVGDDGAIALAESPYLDNLADLCLKENPITERGRTALQARFGRIVKL